MINWRAGKIGERKEDGEGGREKAKGEKGGERKEEEGEREAEGEKEKEIEAERRKNNGREGSKRISREDILNAVRYTSAFSPSSTRARIASSSRNV